MGLNRGTVYAATVVEAAGEKYYLVVSNDRRNAALHSALAVRLTSRDKPHLPSIVALSATDGPLGIGYVVCDDIVELYEDEVRAVVGIFGRHTMGRVGDGLRAALDL